MIKNFDVTKTHLTELADIINRFKSEAVQLRLIELIFSGTDFAPSATPPKPDPISVVPKTKSKRKSRTKSASRTDDSNGNKKRASSGGAVSTLLKIFADGYFKQPRTIGDICAHCEVSLARRIKPNEISGKLGRMVRNNQLSRTKNADNQYTYTNAQ